MNTNDGKVGQSSILRSRRAQLTISFPRLTGVQKDVVNLQAALWCYKSSYPFNMYENPDAKVFLHSINPNEVYVKVKARSDALIASLDSINVSTDESTTINTSRIANISVH